MAELSRQSRFARFLAASASAICMLCGNVLGATSGTVFGPRTAIGIGRVDALAFSVHDGCLYVAVGTAWPNEVLVIAADASESRLLQRVEFSEPIAAIAADGSLILGSCPFNGALTVFDWSTGETRTHPWPQELEVRALALTPEHEVIATGLVRGYPPEGTRAWYWTSDMPAPALSESAVFTAYGPNALAGTLVAGKSASDDGTALLWDLLRPGWVLPLPDEAVTDTTGKSPGDVTALAFSAEGDRIAVGYSLGWVAIWDAGALTCIVASHLEAFDQAIYPLAFSDDGRLLAIGSVSGRIEVWDGRTCGMLGSADPEKPYPIHALAFSPDGTWLASGGVDHQVRLWRIWPDLNRNLK